MINNTTYKQTSIGLVPNDWEVKKLGEIGIFSKGKGILKAQVLGSGLPCIRYGEIYTTHHFVIKEFKSYISEEVASESQEISKGDILFAGSGETIDDIGKAVVYVGNKKAYAGGDTIIFKPEKDNSETISYILEMDSSRKQKRTFGQGNSVVHIYPSELKKLKIPLPPLPEQQKIASILSTWDVAIDNCKAIIEELKVRNTGLAQQLLTGKMRVKGFEETKWIEKKGNKIFRNNTDKTHNGDLEILSATQERGVIPRSMNNIDIKYDKNSLGTYKKVEVGDYVISLRSFQGGIEYSEYEGIVSPAYTILKEIIPISKKFYKVYFKTETFINRLNTIIYGIRDGKQISFGDFATLNIPYPSIEEQNEIAIILDKATEELNKYQQKLQTLQLQKKGLMQQLLTGKVRVKI
jgi:type I restriction enzyme S subunit